MDGVATGEPGLEVALAGAGQGEAVGGEPLEQVHRGLDVLSHDHGLVVGGGRAVDPAAEPAQQMPDRVAV